MTKPEGPAQEPLCLCGHNEATHAVQVSSNGSRLHGCYVCSDCDRYVPATPAPSQPAGAREWLVAQHRANPGHVNWRLMLQHEDVVVELLEAYAREQTAAMERLTVRVDEERRAWESSERHRKAAERERDSLREALKPISNTVAYLRKAYSAGADAEVVHAITDLQRYCTTVDAALKAREDEQQ